MPSLRLLFVHARALELDRRGVAALIADAQPDVAAVQGAPSTLRWRSSCAALAREAGLVVVSGGRTGGGALLLSSLGVDVEGTQDVLFAGSRHPLRPGGTLAAGSRLGAPVLVGAARFGGTGPQRQAQAQEFVAARRALVPDDRPAVLGVDGLQRGSAAWDTVVDGLVPVAGTVLADPRVTVVDVHEFAGGGDVGGVRLEVTLPVA